jgi:hypothetical protein
MYICNHANIDKTCIKCTHGEAHPLSHITEDCLRNSLCEAMFNFANKKIKVKCIPVKVKKKQKYNNTKVEIDGIKFSSKKEANYYGVYMAMVHQGTISNLNLQVKYELIPKIDKQRPCCYIADFVYEDKATGKTIVVDAKGWRTEVYKIKKKLMKWVYNIDIVEV